MAYETIEFEITEGVAVLTLNRPDRMNSFNTEMHAEVRDALKQVKKDDSVRLSLIHI